MKTGGIADHCRLMACCVRKPAQSLWKRLRVWIKPGSVFVLPGFWKG